MIPDTVDIVTTTIEKYSSIIKMNESYYIDRFNVYGIQTSITIKDGEEDHEFYAYVYYDYKTQFDEITYIHERILFFKSEALSKKIYRKNEGTIFKKGNNN